MRRFLIVGQTGVGKSSFINAVFGIERAKTSEFEACTKLVEHYLYKSPFGEVTLIDTPGLSEDSFELDKAYLKLVRESVEVDSIDTILYLSSLAEKRFRPTEMSALNIITKEIGKSIWKNTWLVLTFAASVKSERLQEACDARIMQIADHLTQITKRKKKSGSKFNGFKKIISIDNVIPNWSPDFRCRPIDEMFNING